MDALQEKAIKVIKPLIPPDAEDRVSRTVKQLNAAIRDHIRSETGLKLTDAQNRSAIQVKVTEGFPSELAGLIGRYDDPVLWRLIAAQPKLGGIIDGLQFLLDDWAAFEKWPDLPPVAVGSQSSLERARDVALALQQISVSKKVKEELKAIHEDILGAYRFSVRALPFGPPPWVEIYWMPIALVSAMLDVRIEDLTAVTLSHELAHGYTHLGRDIDGMCWDVQGFASSELGVVEGLAQFYTHIVTEKISARMPGAFVAYERLLHLQSGPYRVHEDWMNNTPFQCGECVRFAMLAARNRGAVKYTEWEAMLSDTSAKLRRRGRSASSPEGLFQLQGEPESKLDE